MKFEAYFNEQVIPLEVQESGSRVTLRINGEIHEADVFSVIPGGYSVLLGGKVYDVFVEGSNNGMYQVSLRDRRISLELLDPRRLKSLRHHHSDADGEVAIISPMPGKVVRWLASEGETVEAGQGLVVVEAMKMQNELKSPRGGRVKSINAHEGKTVNAGDELMVIE